MPTHLGTLFYIYSGLNFVSLDPIVSNPKNISLNMGMDEIAICKLARDLYNFAAIASKH